MNLVRARTRCFMVSPHTLTVMKALINGVRWAGPLADSVSIGGFVYNGTVVEEGVEGAFPGFHGDVSFMTSSINAFVAVDGCLVAPVDLVPDIGERG
jgi:hypothetical protein